MRFIEFNENYLTRHLEQLTRLERNLDIIKEKGSVSADCVHKKS